MLALSAKERGLRFVLVLNFPQYCEFSLHGIISLALANEAQG